MVNNICTTELQIIDQFKLCLDVNKKNLSITCKHLILVGGNTLFSLVKKRDFNEVTSILGKSNLNRMKVTKLKPDLEFTY
jgi:hypothetical protein